MIVAALLIFFICRKHTNTQQEGVFGDEVKSVSVMEGESVTLQTDLTHIQTHDSVEWRFGVNGPVIARIKRSVNINHIYDETEIFRDKLKMNNQTGDLTITHITSQHSGLYHLKMNIGSNQITYNFNLTVYAPTAVSISESTQTPSSSSSSSSSSSVSENVSGVLEDVYSPSGRTHVRYIVLMCCAAVGCVMIVTAFLIFFICRKHTNTHEEVQSREDDVTYITYADTTFYKHNKHIKRVKEEDVVYTEVIMRP
ncbi:uncharacterized protein LOC130430468 isoform X2 [Triplophysa dalaica]|uniref:uncharacterized protein LOC130430468 isoform X2 n=1 Tax=Triplophysa dalaica TaxID=1582913 RepID=UPI0024E019B0|nr:uncharacterized protein LOC130430468 isoform X2 [Triplophysa dalaica]